jgi:acetoin utilization deacetylase AcuC-like enzyme
LKVVYSARYHIDIGPHVFPTRKYPLVHARLIETGVIEPRDVDDPAAASWEDLSRVHTEEYLSKMREGTLSADEAAQLELPWSAGLVEAFRIMVGGTMRAARIACGLVGRSEDLHVGKSEDRVVSRSEDLRYVDNNSDVAQDSNSDVAQDFSPAVCCHIGGGLHHAFPNHGEGFCPFNDVAVAIRDLQSRGLERAAIIDLDVHHGNGTAFIFDPSPDVFTFSMHQQHNYPMWKPKGSLDVGLPDGAGDSRFLRELEQALPLVIESHPQCVFYLAGADPYEDDQLGGLRLTRDGLRHRDRMVIDAVVAAGVPLVVVLAGGYARHLEDTVAIHVATIEEAKRAALRDLSHGTDLEMP